MQVEMGAFAEEFEGFHLSCIVPLERKHGNTELWVDAQSSTWNFLSKLVAHEYRKVEQDAAQSVVDPPATATGSINSEQATPTAHSPKRQSPSDDPDGVCASPSKRQTTLLSFMKSST